MKKNQMQQMCEAGRRCKADYPHRASGGQALDDLPVSALDKSGKPNTARAKMLLNAWRIGFVGGEIPTGARIQSSSHGGGRQSVQVFVRDTCVGDYNLS